MGKRIEVIGVSDAHRRAPTKRFDWETYHADTAQAATDFEADRLARLARAQRALGRTTRSQPVGPPSSEQSIQPPPETVDVVSRPPSSTTGVQAAGADNLLSRLHQEAAERRRSQEEELKADRWQQMVTGAETSGLVHLIPQPELAT